MDRADELVYLADKLTEDEKIQIRNFQKDNGYNFADGFMSAQIPMSEEAQNITIERINLQWHFEILEINDGYKTAWNKYRS